MMRNLLNKYHSWKTRRKMDRVFSRHRDPYGYFSHPHELKKQQNIMKMLSDRRYHFALEIGCAEGAVTRQLAPLCEFLIGVDISPVAIKRAQESCQQFKSVMLLKANVFDLVLPDKLDLIVASEVLYYMDHWSINGNLAVFLKNSVKKLTTGGRVLLLHSFGHQKELEGRKKYRQWMEQFGLKLDKELICGDNPKKCKYLISLLTKDSKN